MLSVVLVFTCSVRHRSSLPSAACCAGRRLPSYSLAPCTCCKHMEYCRECQLGSKHWDCATYSIGYIQHNNCEFSPTQLIAYHIIACIGRYYLNNKSSLHKSHAKIFALLHILSPSNPTYVHKKTYKRLVIIVGYDVSCQMRLGSFSHAITKAKIDCASQEICPYHQVV